MFLAVLNTRDDAQRPLAEEGFFWRWTDCVPAYRSGHVAIATGGATSFARLPLDPGPSPGPCVAVAFDGRIDNASDLLRRCRLSASPGVSDSALAAELYLREGPDFVDRIAGEFRLVVHDERTCGVIGAVDIASTKRLWYREHNRGVVIASAIADLYRKDEDFRLNRDYLIERMATGWNSHRRGPFVDAMRLFAGESLHVRERSLTIRRYWCPGKFQAENRKRTMDDCVAEFAEGLTDAVRVRIPKSGNILCELSGGLDSTTVTSIASKLLGSEAQRRLHAVTVTYPDTPKTDERLRATEVAARAHANHHYLEWRHSEPLFGGIPENTHYWDEPTFNVHSHAMALAKHRIMLSEDCQIVFTGAGAEALLCEQIAWPVFLSDDLLRGRLSDMLSGLRTWQGPRKVSLIYLFYRACVAPLVRPISAITYEARQLVPPWLTRDARRRFRELKRRLPRPTFTYRNISGSWMAEQWQAAGSAAIQGYAASHYDTTFPFLHRPLVESVLRMPWNIKTSPVANKPLLRRLAADVLPASFAKRASSVADPAVGKALAVQRDRIEAFTVPSALAELGIVDPAELSRTIAKVQSGFGTGLRFVVTVLAAELWVRAVQSGQWRHMQMNRSGGSDRMTAPLEIGQNTYGEK